ncbi:hypothetical protein [Neokomagataea anthophila]|uniref:Uncharacterized protein n=1 Tax=Neokomagataea anthophila TaxID=2826925 RepID=A0ABS5E7L4_9PROT|nr:hypothetical protein [Neokomagataea anthophila]MBR0559892.1 hypothetical protein [Neokomagataea anthophila]
MFNSKLVQKISASFLDEAEIPHLRQKEEKEQLSWEEIKHHCFVYLKEKTWTPPINKALSMKVIGKNECWKKLITKHVFF